MTNNAEEARYFRHGMKQLLNADYIMTDNFTFVKDRSLDHIHRRRTWMGEDMLESDCPHILALMISFFRMSLAYKNICRK